MQSVARKLEGDHSFESDPVPVSSIISLAMYSVGAKALRRQASIFCLIAGVLFQYAGVSQA